ncbi:MAG: hypothetical protein IJF78_14220 [Clostridia bacterium]|nr:hypothetical protein [Clostridia bacterium]
MASIPQPAKVSYFFGKGYRDLGNTIKGAWVRNIGFASDELSKAADDGFISWGGGIHLVAAICIYVFGSMLTIFTSVLHISILLTFFCAIYLGFSIVWLIDRIYIFINKIKNACPNPNCQASFLIPTYECPQCHVMHTKLVPGKYGILHRTCNCGCKIPTTFMNGRGDLQAYCPECGFSLSGNTASKQYAIPVIGGPSVGKTCYINMAIEQMISTVAPQKGWEVSFISEDDEKAFKATSSALKKGVRPLKTESDALTAYQLMLTMPNEKIGRRIYVYDIAGEMFSSSGDIQRNNAYNYADGFIFLIDPLSIARYAMEVEDKININSYGVSTKDFDEILNIMLINLEKMFGLSAKDVLKLNLAVVINKMDIPGLEALIGDDAAQAYLQAHPEECKTFADAKNAVCKNFLETYEAGNFVRSASSKFKQVRYFTSSALGHNKEGVPYEGKNVIDPLLWILNKVDGSIKLDS